MIEKFAGIYRTPWSEFLDLNHTRKIVILVSLWIPKFAPGPRARSFRMEALPASMRYVNRTLNI
jgi:hypothetical protein